MTVRLRNTNPMGDVDVPLIGRSLTAGEEFDVSEEHAAILLTQVGNYEAADAAAKALAQAVSGVPAKSAPKAEWVVYATAQGDLDAANQTKEQLVEQYGDDH